MAKARSRHADGSVGGHPADEGAHGTAAGANIVNLDKRRFVNDLYRSHWAELCDTLPPSVMGMLDQNAMVSSMNWQLNIVAEDITTDDGWWLIDSPTHHADHGASSQLMSIWKSRRELMATAMQSVAYYALWKRKGCGLTDVRISRSGRTGA